MKMLQYLLSANDQNCFYSVLDRLTNMQKQENKKFVWDLVQAFRLTQTRIDILCGDSRTWLNYGIPTEPRIWVSDREYDNRIVSIHSDFDILPDTLNLKMPAGWEYRSFLSNRFTPPRRFKTKKIVQLIHENDPVQIL